MEEKTGRANAEQTVQRMRKCRRKVRKGRIYEEKGREGGKEGRKEGKGGVGREKMGAYNPRSKGSKGVVAAPMNTEYCAVNPGPGAREEGQ